MCTLSCAFENRIFHYLISQKKKFLFPSKVYHIFNALSALHLPYSLIFKARRKLVQHIYTNLLALT